ncbi:MFS transporter [Gordonia sp. CPCC 206044]|uniref:MFS transporter n=1 Tax=Gordonia sp. CPCC 206044 TaxID=3140793 RepID=UPI003AF3B605
MFSDPTVAGAGLSDAAISSLFVIWSVSAVVLEVPTGLIADRIPRRILLTLGPIVTAIGFMSWMWWPSYPMFAVGFVLWAAGGSMRSGTLQALLYDSLTARGEGRRYVAVAGRVRAMGAAGVVLGTAAAVPLATWGGYTAAGVASVVSCGVCALASALLPEDAPPSRGPETQQDACHTGSPGMGALAAVRTRAVYAPFALLIALTWIAALDEYLPLLADTMLGGGDAPAGVALLMLVVAVGDIAGGLAAARAPVVRRAVLAGWLLAGALSMAIGAGSGHPAGIVLVAFGFGVLGWALVVADGMLQDRVPSSHRATITSMAGVGEELVAIAAFGAWAVGAQWWPPTILFALAATPYAVLCVVLLWSGATTARASAR